MELVTSTVNPVHTVAIVDGVRALIGACLMNMNYKKKLVLNPAELYIISSSVQGHYLLFLMS